MSLEFDVVVIGAGPGGYIAAIRAAQLGLKVACIEKWKNPAGKNALGGTCLNVGCIPSKALLASSESYEHAKHGLEGHGITVKDVSIDIKKMLERKDAIVSKMTQGIEFLFRKNKITWLKGHGRFIGREGEAVRLELQPDEGEYEIIQARNVIIATGSKARHLPNVPVDNVLVCDNEGALAFDSVPKKLTVIGAGVIGLELGSVWRRLGAEVTVLEMAPSFLGGCDAAVAKEAEKIFRKQGLSFELGVKIGEVKVAAGKNGKGGSVTVHYEDANGKAHSIDSDRLIVSIGRVPNTEGLTLDAVGLAPDERGFIPVDDECRTSVPNIYAIGDVVRGPMLAHKGEEEGVAVAERIRQADVVITTALIPGRKAPVLVTRAMVESMRPGSVVVDMAVEQGGNCELSKADNVVRHQGVSIAGVGNLPAMVPADASAFYARNILDFLKLIVDDEKKLKIDLEDDIVKACLVARDGQVLREQKA